MADRVYHWKHGWIPLTHKAALQKAHGSEAGARKLVPVAQKDLPRKSHVLVGHNADNGNFSVSDTKTGGKARLTMDQADELQGRGTTITGVDAKGVVQVDQPPAVPKFLQKFGTVDSPSHRDAFEGANPDFDRRKVETTVNCLKVTIAYEMRRRGFDVQATPGSARNQAVVAWGGRSYKEAGTREQLESKLAKDPVGARYMVSGYWSSRVGGGGHVWSAEKMPDGSIRYFDAQVGEGDVSKYFSMLRANADKGHGITVLRVDNIKPRPSWSGYLKGGGR